MIQLNQEVCGNLEAALRREWLLTNGLGGFASSTIIGLNTRRYHGLLVAATQPPVGRIVMLSKLEETLFLDGRAFDLSANRYPGAVHPQGFRYLKQFRLDPFPVFQYEVEGIEIEKSVFMVQGENSTVIQYELKSNNRPDSPKTFALEIRPLIAFRDYHSTTHENGAISATIDETPGLASITPYQGLPSLHFGHNAVELRRSGDWFHHFEYDVERERGLDFSEDLFNPCVLRFDLQQNPQAVVIASTEKCAVATSEEYRLAAIRHAGAAVASSPVSEEFAQTLAIAADQFIVARRDQKTIIAGYHWFADWGRDTMIALPGLTLLTGKYDMARSILRTFARSVNQGMLPNRFPDAGEMPEYNTVDATLWFFETARSFLEYAADLEFVRSELYPAFADIIAWHVRGTRYGIKVSSDGLLVSGEPGVQLTWMDAKVGDWVVTPRRGKPVEIQALWYNALRIMENFAGKFGDEAEQERYREMADVASASFNRLFWNEKDNCLNDVVDESSLDASIRPNQIFAVSLAHSMLSPARAKAIVEKVEAHLLTPFGLRTLSPSDPQYRGRYIGGPAERDAAYHQGTVWPWLIGAFVTAYVKVNGGTQTARTQAGEWLTPLLDHLCDSGLGQIPEIFDGDAPQQPRGCIAQAWSVAEVLRAYVENVKGLSPLWQLTS